MFIIYSEYKQQLRDNVDLESLSTISNYDKRRVIKFKYQNQLKYWKKYRVDIGKKFLLFFCHLQKNIEIECIE